MLIDCVNVGQGELYRILTGTVIPRPIAWVSSRGENGVDNLAPFSFFNVVSVNPPMVAFSPGYKVDAVTKKLIEKDTLKNIRASGEFVVNLVDHSLAEKMNLSSSDLPSAQSEFDLAGLERASAAKVRCPLVAAASVSFECRLFHIHELGGSTLILGEIVAIHLKDGIWQNGTVDLSLFQPVGRLGENLYCTINDRFEIKRP
jgi:flavin reductase (DIM6/NTAB) family NADH-FMN oxidoreductase RutF